MQCARSDAGLVPAYGETAVRLLVNNFLIRLPEPSSRAPKWVLGLAIPQGGVGI